MSSSGKFGAEAVTIITSNSILRGDSILLPTGFSISYGSRADFFFHLTDLSRKPPFLMLSATFLGIILTKK